MRHYRRILGVVFTFACACTWGTPWDCAARYSQITPGVHLEFVAPGNDLETLFVNPDGGPGVAVSEAPRVPGYFVDRLLGSGGEGRVFLAYSSDGTHSVALKVTPRAVQEHSALERTHRTDHPGRRYVLKPVLLEGNQILGLEPMAMRLSDLLGDTGRGISPRQVDALIGQIRSALEAVHAAGLVHGDVKPHNIFITPNGEIRLGDFGAAVSEGSTHISPGTPGFSSGNQQALGKATSADDWHGFDATVAALRETVARPPLNEADLARVASVMGLPLDPFRRPEGFDWRGFARGVAQNLHRGDALIPPDTVQLIQRLAFRSGHIEIPPAVLDRKTYRYTLAQHPRAKLVAARDALKARFDRIAELARAQPPDWIAMRELMKSPLPELNAIFIHYGEHTGGWIFPAKNLLDMKPGDVFPSYNNAIIGEDGPRPSWAPQYNRVAAFSYHEVELSDGRRMELFSPNLPTTGPLAERIAIARRTAAQRDVITATEEFGHLLQDLNLLSGGSGFVAEAAFDPVLAAHPHLRAAKLPLIRAPLHPTEHRRLKERMYQDRLLYTREADIYLFMVSLFGKQEVQHLRENYGERLALHNHLP